MTQPTLFDLTPEPPPIDHEWIRKCERFDELIDASFERDLTEAERNDFNALRKLGCRSVSQPWAHGIGRD